MLRLAERNTRNAGSRTSGAGLQLRPSEVVVHDRNRPTAGSGRQAVVLSGRRPIDSDNASNRPGAPAERHDWLVPLELP